MDLESDDFFDPGIQSVIVLDDLMSTAAKDSRFKDLFTEGISGFQVSDPQVEFHRDFFELL
jgi:hypothetical protein